MKRTPTRVAIQNVGKTQHLKTRTYSCSSSVRVREGARSVASLRLEQGGHLTQRKVSTQRPEARSRVSRFCLSSSISPHCCCTAGGEVMANTHGDSRVAGIAASIRAIPDFPKQGILFRDVTTLLLDHKAFQDTIDIFVERYKDKKIDVIVGIEARGFIFGPPIALAIGAKFVPQRKPRKLPGEVVKQEYSLEYGTDCIEMHVGAVQPGDRCVLVDDLIATGGTLAAGIKLVERVGAEVVECACLVELSDLKGREKLSGTPLFILVDFEGE